MLYRALAGSVTITVATMVAFGAAVALGGTDGDSSARAGAPTSALASDRGVPRCGCVAAGQVCGRGKSRIPNPERDLIVGPFAIRALKDPYWADSPELFERRPGDRYVGSRPARS